MNSIVKLIYFVLFFSQSFSKAKFTDATLNTSLKIGDFKNSTLSYHFRYLEDFDYPSPDNVTVWTSDELLEKLGQALTPIYNDYESYHGNNCTDERISSLYGSDLDTLEYNEICVSLIYDWSQAFTNYTCNKRFCNYQGLCKTSIDESGFVTPSCKCNSGYNGQTCMFTSTNYIYATKWVKAVETWVFNNTNIASSLGESENVANLIQILGNLFYFTSNVNVEDLDYFGQITNKILVAILSSDRIGGDPSLNQEILKFIDEILRTTDSSFNGFDLSEIYRYCYSDYQSSHFGSYSKPIDPKSAITIAPVQYPSNLRVLFKRYLTNNTLPNPSKKTDSFAVNQASPSLYIPQNAVALLDPAFKISFTFVRDPKPFNQLDGPTVMSQIVTAVASSGKTTLFEYPQRADRMTITIPWSIVPYVNSNYPSNCKVYSFNRKNWVIANSCKVESATNNTIASISCNLFGTYGVACVGSQAAIPKRSISSSYISTSIILLGLLFVFYSL